MTDHKRTYSQRGDDYLLEAQRVCGEDKRGQDKPAPRCPYCGTPMVGEERIEGAYWYECYKCGATAPTEETEQAAYTAAMQRWQEPNRVLTLGEVQVLAYAGYEQQHVLAVEYRAIIKGGANVFRPCVVAPERLRMIEIWEIYNGASMTLMEKSMYGKRWRCWLRKPTQEEREAAPWEGD